MKNSGSVLIEILTVVFIIAVLTVILVANFPEIRENLALRRAAHQLVQDLRRAQEMAMSSMELKEVEGSCFLPLHFAFLTGGPIAVNGEKPIKEPQQLIPTLLPAKGYGIYIDLENCTAPDICGTPSSNTSYKLYADTAADTPGTPDCPPGPDPCYEYYTAQDCIVKTIQIEERGVFIKEIKGYGDSEKISINFKPPNPNTNIKWAQPDIYGEIEIVLALKTKQDKTKSVVVNRAGMIAIK